MGKDAPESVIAPAVVEKTSAELTDQLLKQAYDDLRRLARSRLAKAQPSQSVQPTELVHEVYLRIFAQNEVSFQNPYHFFFAAARTMHDILVERARRKASLKRGGGKQPLNLDRVQVPVDAPPEEFLALSEALELLAESSPRQHQVIMLRFFAGCTNEEVAQAMNQSTRTIDRDWKYAKAWLHEKLSAS